MGRVVNIFDILFTFEDSRSCRSRTSPFGTITAAEVEVWPFFAYTFLPHVRAEGERDGYGETYCFHRTIYGGGTTEHPVPNPFQ